MLRRITILGILFFVLSGCSVSPWQNRQLDDGAGGQKEYFFAYGKYCGPGWPPLTQGQKLIDYWPPADDMDAICYAHEICYELTFYDNRLCDSAFHRMAISYQTRFKNKGCWNLATDITIAFFAKNYGKGVNDIETSATQITHTLLGVPAAAFWAVLKTPLRPFLKDSDEGACNVGETSDPELVISTFEYKYKNLVLNRGSDEIHIPVPHEWSNPPVERGRREVVLPSSLRGFAAPAAPHLAR